MARLILIVSWYIGLGVATTMIWVIAAAAGLHKFRNISYLESVERVTTYAKTSGLLTMTFLWPAVWFYAVKHINDLRKKDLLEALRDIDEMSKDIYKNS